MSVYHSIAAVMNFHYGIVEFSSIKTAFSLHYQYNYFLKILPNLLQPWTSQINKLCKPNIL